MADLNKARQDINAIDKQMAELFMKRMDAVKVVAEYKKEHGVPVTDAAREAEVIKRNSDLIADDDYRSYYVSFLQNNMELSKAFQHRLLDGMRVAYSGVTGAFANIVAKYSVSERGESIGTGTGREALFANYYKDEALETAYTLDDIKSFLKDSTIYYVNSAESATMGITYTYQAEKYTLWESLTKSWPFCINLCGMILSALAGLFTGATAVKDMGGTITAVSQIAEISQMGLDYFLLLLPLLAMNLALFNVLPIPSLDGARALFVFIELIFRKPVPRKIEGWIHTIGLFLLLGLVIFFDVYHFAVVASRLML